MMGDSFVLFIYIICFFARFVYGMYIFALALKLQLPFAVRMKYCTNFPEIFLFHMKIPTNRESSSFESAINYGNFDEVSSYCKKKERTRSQDRSSFPDVNGVLST